MDGKVDRLTQVRGLERRLCKPTVSGPRNLVSEIVMERNSRSAREILDAQDGDPAPAIALEAGDLSQSLYSCGFAGNSQRGISHPEGRATAVNAWLFGLSRGDASLESSNNSMRITSQSTPSAKCAGRSRGSVDPALRAAQRPRRRLSSLPSGPRAARLRAGCACSRTAGCRARDRSGRTLRRGPFA